MRAFAVIVVALALVATGVPVASATHWSIHGLGVGRSAGVTFEDDNERISAPGNVFDGRDNRVVYPGRSLGDGSLFLDARLGNSAGFQYLDAVGPDVPSGYASSAVTGRSDLILPGAHHVSAWYGWWSDRDDDGVILDEHDGTCGACAVDEFVWRGKGSDESVAMHYYVLPRHQPTYWTSAYGDPREVDGLYGDGDMVDRTGRSEAEQAWVGRSVTVTTDAGLLSTIRVITLAGAGTALASPLGYDLDDPLALLDVDRYEALDPEVAALWTSAFATLDAGQVTIYEVILPLERDALNETNAILASDLTAPARGAFGLAFNTALGLVATASEGVETVPWDGKEPNHPDDASEGRAFFGGIGDVWGSFNTYPGHLDSHHLFVDNAARTMACAGGYARAPVLGESRATAPCFWSATEPVSANAGDRRGSGTALGFVMHVQLWRDMNLDAHVGEVCDPNDPAQFDAERNTCRPERHYRANHRINEYSEVVDACPTSSAPNGLVTLTPVGGPWPNVIVVKDAAQSTRVAFDPDRVTVRSDTAPIVLRYEGACVIGGTVSTRDIIIFPEGASLVPIRVDATVSLDRFKDLALGIENGYESARDVDLLPALL